LTSENPHVNHVLFCYLLAIANATTAMGYLTANKFVFSKIYFRKIDGNVNYVAKARTKRLMAFGQLLYSGAPDQKEKQNP